MTSGAHTLRDYQRIAIENVEKQISDGSRAVCLVSCTGSGKTTMGAEVARRYIAAGKRVLWLAHRNELIKQAAQRLQGEGIRYVGVVAPWSAPSPHAPCQVASLQTLAARPDFRPAADLIVADECHHLLATEFRAIHSSPEYEQATTVGLTATPERSDGQALGDIFDSLVVAATYSQLIAAGHILPCKVFQPPERLQKDLAQDPVLAYQRYTPGQKAFCFTNSVQQAKDIAAEFNAAGVSAAVVEAKTPAGTRAEILRRFEFGDLQVICNAYILTEGYDAPAASVCILARKCGHVTPYLQMCGRVLRPFPGQFLATLIDLTGASLKPTHGLPTEDREYSLEGRGIRRLLTEQIRSCPKCGMVVEPGQMVCDNIEITTGELCGFRWVPGVRTPPRYLSLELREVYAGTETPEPAKRREWERLLSKGTLAQAAVKFRETFGHPSPYVTEIPEETRRQEYRRLRKVGRIRGYSDGWVAHQFKAALGAFPPWAWSREPLDAD